MRIVYTQADPKKHSVRFDNNDPLDAPIRTIYVSNEAVQKLGWQPGKKLVVNLSVE